LTGYVSGVILRKRSDVLSIPEEILGRTCRAHEGVEWVAANLSTDFPDESSCPSPTAWNLLMDLRELGGRDRCAVFWNGLYTKLLPSKQQIEQEQKFSDDQDELEGFISNLVGSDGVDKLTLPKRP
jgi:hypothetical protein